MKLVCKRRLQGEKQCDRKGVGRGWGRGIKGAQWCREEKYSFSFISPGLLLPILSIRWDSIFPVTGIVRLSPSKNNKSSVIPNYENHISNISTVKFFHEISSLGRPSLTNNYCRLLPSHDSLLRRHVKSNSIIIPSTFFIVAKLSEHGLCAS